MCRQAGATRAANVEEAFEAAATFATQPAPVGPNVVVLTTAGGWGVVTADAISRDRDLRLLPLPADLEASIDAKLPSRWSRNNPVDCAGGETRDTIPEVMELIAAHPEVIAGRAAAFERIDPNYGGDGPAVPHQHPLLSLLRRPDERRDPEERDQLLHRPGVSHLDESLVLHTHKQGHDLLWHDFSWSRQRATDPTL